MTKTLGLARLRRLFGRSEAPQYWVGVQIQPASVALVALSQDSGGCLQVAESVPIGTDGVGGALAQLVKRHGLAGSPTRIVLAGDEYESQQVDIPGVPDEELLGAARLRVRELSSIPFEEAHVAVRRLHSDRKPDGGSMVSVAVARARQVEARVAEVRESGLHPVQVLPRDFALCGLAAQMPDPERGLAMLHIGQDDGRILITRGERLYLTRGHRYGARALGQLGERATQGIVLETQRSLDYFESQLSTSQAGQLLVLPAAIDRSRVVDALNEVLSVPAARLDLRQVIESAMSPEAFGDDEQAAVLLALAGAIAPSQAAGASFYEPPEHRLDPLGAVAIAGYVGSAALIAVIAAVAQHTWVQAAEERATQAERVQEQAQARLADLEARLEAREPDQELIARRDELEAEIELREGFAEALGQLDQARGEGFAAKLDALARQRIEGLWLTRIRFHDAELRLEGRAVRAALVPAYLERLAGEPEFEGVRFERFELTQVKRPDDEEAEGEGFRPTVLRPDLGGVVFRIATEPAE